MTEQNTISGQDSLSAEPGNITIDNAAPLADPQSIQKDPAKPTFADLGVIEPIREALAAHGILSPFPIQALAIPIAVDGHDLVGQARTGTGKTLAFGIPILQHVVAPEEADAEQAADKRPQALVLTPTRELALQVAGDIETASEVRKVRVLCIYGGVGYDPQLEALEKGVDVVVGTPGRVLDLLHRHALDLSGVRTLVLDEADEMLDLGFLPDVERLIAATPTERQTMLFSATMPAGIIALARTHLNQPINVRAETQDAQMTVPDTTQFVFQAHDLDKPEIIAKMLQAPGVEKVMIFTRTKRHAQRISDDLEDRGFNATSIHGDLTQAARERALSRFREGKATVLVATDVAARGIDVTGVSHVVNYECPDDEKTYVHRIGRTGRAGAKGIAVTLVDWSDVTRWKVINKALNLPFDELEESYSTTPQLLEDLQIPEGTKGRLPGSHPKERHSHDGDFLHSGRDARSGGNRRGDSRHGDSRHSDSRHSDSRHSDSRHEESRAERSENRRPRRRTRNGAPIEEGAPVEAPRASASAADSSDAPRRRRRHRGGRGHHGGQNPETTTPTLQQGDEPLSA